MLNWWSLGLTHAVTPYGWVRRIASTIYGLHSPLGQVSSVQPNEGNNYFLDEEGSSVPSSMTRVPPCRHHSVEILACISTRLQPMQPKLENDESMFWLRLTQDEKKSSGSLAQTITSVPGRCNQMLGHRQRMTRRNPRPTDAPSYRDPGISHR